MNLSCIESDSLNSIRSISSVKKYLQQDLNKQLDESLCLWDNLIEQISNRKNMSINSINKILKILINQQCILRISKKNYWYFLRKIKDDGKLKEYLSFYEYLWINKKNEEYFNCFIIIINFIQNYCYDNSILPLILIEMNFLNIIKLTLIELKNIHEIENIDELLIPCFGIIYNLFKLPKDRLHLNDNHLEELLIYFGNSNIHINTEIMNNFALINILSDEKIKLLKINGKL